jgi:hypothetical protein
MHKIKFKCDICGEVFYDYKSQRKDNRHNFCSTKCEWKWLSKYKSGENSPLYKKRIKTKCNNCGRDIFITQHYFKIHKHFFCNNRGNCYNEFRTLIKGRNHPNWKGGKIIVNCGNCKKEIKIYPYYFIRNEHNFCKNNYKCYSKWISGNRCGEKNTNYIHGQSNKPYNLKFDRRFKNYIRKRDHYRCQYPGCKITQKKHLKLYNQKLHVHHIDYDKSHADELRSITLCNIHNIKVNKDRDYWFAYFSYILGKMYKKIGE